MIKLESFLKYSIIALIILWIGSTWTIGYLVVPVLFKSLFPNAMLAGKIEGQLFYIVNWIGFISSIVAIICVKIDEIHSKILSIILYSLLILCSIDLFLLQPYIEDIKSQAGNIPVMLSSLKSKFSMWHGISSILYLIRSLLLIGFIKISYDIFSKK